MKLMVYTMVSLREKTRMHVSETSSILSIYTPDSTYAEPERRELSPYNQTKTKENETKGNEIQLVVLHKNVGSALCIEKANHLHLNH
ncbi:hypothetical protein GJ496_010173 [Pomphorhynchus laevis]|nr:hypothetical protein GJ496_011182 [Pomphorhynchus laevis]KAI0981400.1 hypothetical protein GJ496_010173 [Pomphorhynchus laevis]